MKRYSLVYPMVRARFHLGPRPGRPVRPRMLVVGLCSILWGCAPAETGTGPSFGNGTPVGPRTPLPAGTRFRPQADSPEAARPLPPATTTAPAVSGGGPGAVGLVEDYFARLPWPPGPRGGDAGGPPSPPTTPGAGQGETPAGRHLRDFFARLRDPAVRDGTSPPTTAPVSPVAGQGRSGAADAVEDFFAARQDPPGGGGGTTPDRREP